MQGNIGRKKSKNVNKTRKNSKLTFIIELEPGKSKKGSTPMANAQKKLTKTINKGIEDQIL